MKVKELKNLLEEFPDDLEIELVNDDIVRTRDIELYHEYDSYIDGNEVCLIMGLNKSEE